MNNTTTAEPRTKSTYQNAKLEALYFALGRMQEKADEFKELATTSQSLQTQEILMEKAKALEHLKHSILVGFEDGRL